MDSPESPTLNSGRDLAEHGVKRPHGSRPNNLSRRQRRRKYEIGIAKKAVFRGANIDEIIRKSGVVK